MKKLHYAITYFFIGIVVMACLFFSGCNTPEKLQRQSDKHFFKALAKDKTNVHGRCSDIAPPIVMTRDSFIYKPGKVTPGETKYIEIDCDSVVNETKKSGSLLNSGKVNLKCPPCDSVRVDTFYQSKHNTAVDNNKVKHLEGVISGKDKEIAALQIEVATEQQKKKLYRNAAFILGIAWVLFFVWKFVKSKFKIFG